MWRCRPVTVQCSRESFWHLPRVVAGIGKTLHIAVAESFYFAGVVYCKRELQITRSAHLTVQRLSIAKTDARCRGRLLTEARSARFDGVGLAGVLGIRPTQGPNIGKRNADRLRREMGLERDVIHRSLPGAAGTLQSDRDGQIVVQGDKRSIAYGWRVRLVRDNGVGQTRLRFSRGQEISSSEEDYDNEKKLASHAQLQRGDLVRVGQEGCHNAGGEPQSRGNAELTSLKPPARGQYGRPKKSPAPNLAHRSVAIFRQ